MPRINIEDKWWGDPRRSRLVSLLGNVEAEADGAFVIAIKLAQQYWIPNKEHIPMKSWKGAGIADELITCGLAEITNDGKTVYVSGSEEHFAWWFKKQEAGRRGGMAKASNARECLPEPSKVYQALPSSSSSISNNNNREQSAKASQPSLGRKLNKGELEQFVKNVQTNLDTTKPLPRSLVANYLRWFDSLDAAEDFLSDVFGRAQAKYPEDSAQQLKYLSGAMHNHAQAEKKSAMEVTYGF